MRTDVPLPLKTQQEQRGEAPRAAFVRRVVAFSNSGNHRRQQRPSRTRGLVQGCFYSRFPRHGTDMPPTRNIPAGTRISTQPMAGSPVESGYVQPRRYVNDQPEPGQAGPGQAGPAEAGSAESEPEPEARPAGRRPAGRPKARTAAAEPQPLVPNVEL